MNDAPAPQHIPLPGFIRRSSHQYRWSMAITLALLLIQAAIFWGVAISLFSSVDWELVETLDEPPEIVLRQIIRAIVLVPFGAALLLCALFCALWPRAGWHLAMIAESLILLVGLQVYLSDREQLLTDRHWLYLHMFVAILAVVFMNSPEGKLLLGQNTGHSRADREL
ncbi:MULTISPECIES: hypothetical protein [Caldilinea]|jgi:hypothetical protein|nr:MULTISPECIES: hypothetical protein [Caldilinea]MBO9393347.1 hypothetical protein [Caldilinea sp.]GIV75227.1 MAG: hypothetical protein KatS3mg049_3783 [Caldilinea sp.]